MSGEQDYKVSTLLALADRLGLELMLVPKEARAMFGAGPGVDEPADFDRFALVKGGKVTVHTHTAHGQGAVFPAKAGQSGQSGVQSKVQARLVKFRRKDGV